MTANITFKEYLKSFFYILEPYNRYRKTYENFFHVLIIEFLNNDMNL